jgi:hypothetical protein
LALFKSVFRTSAIRSKRKKEKKMDLFYSENMSLILHKMKWRENTGMIGLRENT